MLYARLAWAVINQNRGIESGEKGRLHVMAFRLGFRDQTISALLPQVIWDNLYVGQWLLQHNHQVEQGPFVNRDRPKGRPVCCSLSDGRRSTANVPSINGIMYPSTTMGWYARFSRVIVG